MNAQLCYDRLGKGRGWGRGRHKRKEVLLVSRQDSSKGQGRSLDLCVKMPIDTYNEDAYVDPMNFASC